MATPVARGSNKSKSTTSGSITGVVVPAGGLLVVGVGYSPGTFIDIPPVWNGAGMTALTARAGVGAAAQLFYLYSAGGGTSDVTWDFDDFTYYEAHAATLSDPSTSTPFDKETGTTGTSTSPSSGATAATTQADEVAFGLIMSNGPVEDNVGTPSNSYSSLTRDGTTGGGATSNATADLLYKVLTSTGAQTAAKTGITSREWAAAIGTFKITPSAPQSSTPSSVALVAAVGAAVATAGAVSSAVASVALVAALNGGTGVPGSVSSTPASVALTCAGNDSTGVAGLRVVSAESVAMSAEMTLAPGDVVFVLSADRDPTQVVSQSFIVIRPTSPPELGDADASTFLSTGVSPGSMPPGGTTLAVTATVLADPVIDPTAQVDYVVFRAVAWREDNFGTAPFHTNFRIAWSVGSDTSSHAITNERGPEWGDPSSTPLRRDSDGVDPGDTVDLSYYVTTGPITTQPNGQPWSVAALAALANVAVKYDVSEDAGYGDLEVAEILVEAYGPLGSAPGVVRLRQRIGDLRRPQKFIQQVEE